MPNTPIKHINLNGTVYDVGGGTVTNVATGTGLTGGPITETGTISLDTTYGLTVSDITTGTDTDNKLVSAKTLADVLAGSAATVNDGPLKLQKDSETAETLFTANQLAAATLKYTTSSVGSASNWSAGTLPSLGTAISADDITSWTANTPTAIDTTKFSGGSYTRGTFSGGSFTQGVDSFTANVPTAIDTTKFSGGSYTRGAFSGGSFTQGTDSFTTNTPTVVSYTVSNASATASNPTTLILGYTAGTAATFTQGTDSFTAATHAADSFTPAAISSGFATAGTAASFTQGNDSFTAATHAADSFTPAAISTGFYTAGSAASLSYTSRTIPNLTSVGTLPTLSVTSTTVVIGMSKV